jgi:hypothetical protein
VGGKRKANDASALAIRKRQQPPCGSGEGVGEAPGRLPVLARPVGRRTSLFVDAQLVLVIKRRIAEVNDGVGRERQCQTFTSGLDDLAEIGRARKFLAQRLQGGGVCMGRAQCIHLRAQA